VGEEHEFFCDWRELAAALRLAQCKEETKRQDVVVPSWYLLDGRTGMQMARPFNPVEDHLEADEGLEISCAVSAPVPSCAIWNLLDNQGEGHMPLFSTADWLKFVVGRSSADQVELTIVMAKILLRARWADACCQKMFSGRKMLHRRHREIERELDAMTASCDKAHRSAHRDRVLLSESSPASSKWRCARMC